MGKAERGGQLTPPTPSPTQPLELLPPSPPTLEPHIGGGEWAKWGESLQKNILGMFPPPFPQDVSCSPYQDDYIDLFLNLEMFGPSNDTHQNGGRIYPTEIRTQDHQRHA